MLRNLAPRPLHACMAMYLGVGCWAKLDLAWAVWLVNPQADFNKCWEDITSSVAGLPAIFQY